MVKEYQTKFSDLQNQILPNQFEITKLQNDNDYFKKEYEFVRNDLAEKVKEEMKLKRESSQQILTLETELNVLKHNYEDIQSRCNVLVVSTPLPHS